MADTRHKNEQTPAVWFENVSQSYGPQVDVLSGVDFELPAQSFKLAYLALRPTRGRVNLFGVDTSALNRSGLAKLRRRIGVVFQEFRLLDHLTAYENVALPLRVVGLSERQYRDDVMELLSWVGLGDRMDARPPTLSGGEKQRVAIARAIVGKPDLLIADEPTGNVDAEMGERLLRLFLELNKRLGTTVLIATHDMDMVRNSGAEILRLSDGSLMRQPALRRATPKD